MPRPRKAQVSLEATPYHHCTSRCVRRAFLCGETYEHRRAWVEDRILKLAEVFAIDAAALAASGLELAVLPDDHNAVPLKRIADCPPGLVGGFWLLTHPDLRHTGRIKLLMEHLMGSFRGDGRFVGVVRPPAQLLKNRQI